MSEVEAVYIENLEQDIIKSIAEMKHLDLRKAMDIFYKSKLSAQITNRELGIENLDAKYLAEDLIENEPELFKPSVTKVTPGLAEGKWKYPKDINAFDDEVAEAFKEYLPNRNSK